ncbi:holo-ACP synthase [bacterium]|nr:holo-ACP synthase [bacterium]
MIYGNGIDVIDIKYGNRFKKRCFSISEIERSEKKFKSVESYAKRYAAKEACAKALGTGLARGVFWKDIEVVNNQYGKPFIKLHGKAREAFKNMNKTSNKQIEVSLSDEKKYAIANVTIYD